MWRRAPARRSEFDFHGHSRVSSRIFDGGDFFPASPGHCAHCRGRRAAINFAKAARNADVAVFYYSGHAMQYAGVNYLIAVDAQLADEADLRRATRVDDVLDDLKQAKNLRILVLDSCRDNPLAEELKRSIGRTRSGSITRGLAKIDSPDGTIISYSTQSGRTAADGDGRNSPYTAAFLRHIEDRDEISTVFHHISADVYDSSSGAQVPELSLSFFGEFYLNGKLQVTVSPAPRPPADPCASAGDHWKSAEAIGTSAAFEDHLARYPTCAFAGLARARLDALKAKQATVAPAPAAPPNAVIPNDANRAAAVPDATCASESSLKSLNGNQSVTMTFQNQSSEPITAFWLDYSGKRVFYRRLNGGESYAQPTYISHPWVFVDANGKCRRIVMPSISQKVVAIR
jgi:hypothetical protein